MLLTAFAPHVYGDLAGLRQRQLELETARDKANPAVVAINDGMGFGTGVVVTADGIILTASHVVDSPQRFRSRRPRRIQAIFPNGETFDCSPLGRNRNCDAAVLKIIKRHAGQSFPFAPMGKSAEVRRGDWCFAMGHPGGRRDDRPAVMRLGRVQSVSDQTIVSDAAIVLGDSGGPLFDLQGQVIGIHSMITRVIVENRHVAVDVWHRDWGRLLSGDRWGKLRVNDDELASTSFVGIAIDWKDYRASVHQVRRGSPADRAGFQPGDNILEINGRTFADRLGFRSLLLRSGSGEQVTFLIQRQGQPKQLQLITGPKPQKRDDDSAPGVEERKYEREFQQQLSFKRRIGPNEKRARTVMRDYSELTQPSLGSIVQFISNGEQVALGIVMSRDGDVLTKASEIARATDPICVLADGSERSFRRIGSDTSWDLMLVNADGNDLQPVEWNTQTPVTGRMLISPDVRGRPMLPGVVGIPPTRLATSSQGFLGVRLGPNRGRNPPQIKSMMRGGAAIRDGLRDGDKVLAINGRDVYGNDDLVERIKEFAPYEQIRIKVLRPASNSIQSISVTLTPRFVSDREDAMLDHYYSEATAGKFASIHNSGFPEVIQHDTDLFPHQCGGPLLDLSGRAVGMNIARAARIISYAIPAIAVQKVYRDLREDGVATR